MNDIKFIYKFNRDTYSSTLINLVNEGNDIIVLDADLSTSIKTVEFKNKFPQRHFNCGIAEQNMIGVASGLAIKDKIPFVSTFPVFGCGRAYEQIRYCAINKLNVNFVFTHAGLDLAKDGITHQMVEDISVMRSLPNMEIIVPSDIYETAGAIRFAAASKNPTYIRLSRDENIIVNKPDYKFILGKSTLLHTGDEIAILTYGNMIEYSLIAAYELEKKEIAARVINISTLKPINKEDIISIAKNYNKIITVEDHSIIGGLGSAVADILIQNYSDVKMRIIGINDQFGRTGDKSDLYEYYGLTSKNIYNIALELFGE
jgi:transketolase